MEKLFPKMSRMVKTVLRGFRRVQIPKVGSFSELWAFSVRATFTLDIDS
jgi:hypothetical protein